MPQASMHLKILLPFEIFTDVKNIINIIAEARGTSFGILPHRLDCVAALVPSILTFKTKSEGETYVAIDEGVLIKTGMDVLVSVRSAVSGPDLSKLRQLVEDEYIQLNEQQRSIRTVLTKMESGFTKRLSEFRHE